jgi:PAS domain S-box-containing protein
MEGKPSYEHLEARVKALEEEVAERQRAEGALRESEANYRLAFSAESDAIIIVDADKKQIVDVNKAASRLYGYSKEELIGRDAIMISAEPEKSLEHMARVASGQSPFVSPGPVQRLHKKKDGTVFPVEISSGYYIFQDRKMICAIIRSIAERKKAEEALRASEDRYRRMTEAVTDYTYSVRIQNGRAVETIHGPGCVAVTGYTAEDFQANPFLWIEMVPEEDRQPVQEQARRFLSGLEVKPLEHRIVCQDGTMRWVRNTPVPRHDGGESVLHYDGVVQDISERKRAEDALRESEARYREIIERTKNGVAVYKAVDEGNDFIFVDFNRAGEKIEDIDKTDVIGKSVVEVFPGVKEFGLFEVFQRVWASGNPEHYPVSLYRDDRIVGWRDNFVYKLPSGEIVAVYSDETARKQAEEALRQAHEELQHFSQELEKKVQQRTMELEEKNKQLIAAERLAAMGTMANKVAHELRNSLMAIGGFARRMNDKTLDDDPKKAYVQIILQEVMALEKKVSEIINLENMN